MKVKHHVVSARICFWRNPGPVSGERGERGGECFERVTKGVGEDSTLTVLERTMLCLILTYT
jgi:hypothetical protein